MGGGLMQLVAYGAQDIYLTGNPQITFFKVVYRRHTNFSMETIQQTFNGAPSQGGNSVATISRNGDLVYKCYVTDSAGTTTSKSEWIQEVELEIGGQRIDRHYKEWMNIWNELSTPESKAIGLKAMQLDIGAKTDADNGTGVVMAQIPLLFWFCRNPGMALPLIALQYHEVKLKFKWGSDSHGFVSTCKPQLWCDYIYLDTDERRRFAQVSHEYLIEQVQKESYTEKSGDHKLNFNHPVKELIWTTTGPNAYKTAKLRLNGHDRFASQEDEYFQLRQPFDYHTAVPRQNLPSAAQLMANSVTFRTDNLTEGANTLATAARATGGGKLSSEAIGDLSARDIIVPTSGTFRYGQTSTIFGSFSDATLISGNFSSAVASKIAYIFNLANEPGVNFVAGHTYRITVSGAGSQAGDSGTKAVITRVDKVVTGLVASTSGGAGTIGDAVVAVYFSELLTQGDGEKVGTGATVVNIETVEELIAETVLTTQARTSQMTRKINVYSFALKPEEHQPSGTCNFSRIDNAQLNFEIKPNAGGNIYAVNYNVLRIMSGMGGLAYSN